MTAQCAHELGSSGPKQAHSFRRSSQSLLRTPATVQGRNVRDRSEDSGRGVSTSDGLLRKALGRDASAPGRSYSRILDSISNFETARHLHLPLEDNRIITMTELSGFIRDASGIWGDYQPLFYTVGAFFSLWTFLCLSAVTSIRWTQRNPETHSRSRFWLALGPLLVSAVGGAFCRMYLFLDPNISMDPSLLIKSDLRWLFLLPAFLGLFAFMLWIQASLRMQPASVRLALN